MTGWEKMTVAIMALVCATFAVLGGVIDSATWERVIDACLVANAAGGAGYLVGKAKASSPE